MDPILTDVDIDGGTLAVARWGRIGVPTAVAAHGITSHHGSWALVGQRLADRGLALLAPDLRGRGASMDPGEQSSLARHADDLLAIAGSGDVTSGVIAGHSMGGFVAALAGVRHPDQVAAVVLADGGPALMGPLPEGTDVEAVLHQIIGPALERLSTNYASRQAYRDFWRAHPALHSVDGALVDAYADYDLRPDDGGADGDAWGSRVSRKAVLADGRDTVVDEQVRTAVADLRCPTTFLYAERGMLDGPEGLYSEQRVHELLDPLDHVTVQRIDDVNHYTISLAPTGADAIADAIEAALNTG